MSLTAVNAISDMVAPVVLLTTGGMLSNGLLNVYNAANDRLREMTRERLDIRSGPQGQVLGTAEIAAIGLERLAEIDHQLPIILRRHQLTRIALLVIYSAISIFGLSVILIAAAVAEESKALGQAALGLVVTGTAVLIGGLVVAAISLASSANAISYAIKRTGSIGR